MTEFSNVTSAIGTEGFVDFYELLGLPGTADSALVQERINDLYSKAQDNREHRHTSKRHEAEMLLELLPQALQALSNPENRARYDAYAVASRAGAAPMEFNSFMNTLAAGEEVIRRGGLTIRTPQIVPQSASQNAPVYQTPEAALPARQIRGVSRSKPPGLALPIALFVGGFILSDSVLDLAPMLCFLLPAALATGARAMQVSRWRARKTAHPVAA